MGIKEVLDNHLKDIISGGEIGIGTNKDRVNEEDHEMLLIG